MSVTTTCAPVLADPLHDRPAPVGRTAAAAATTPRLPDPALLELLGSLPALEGDWASALDWALQEPRTEVGHEVANP